MFQMRLPRGGGRARGPQPQRVRPNHCVPRLQEIVRRSRACEDCGRACCRAGFRRGAHIQVARRGQVREHRADVSIRRRPVALYRFARLQVDAIQTSVPDFVSAPRRGMERPGQMSALQRAPGAQRTAVPDLGLNEASVRVNAAKILRFNRSSEAFPARRLSRMVCLLLDNIVWQQSLQSRRTGCFQQPEEFCLSQSRAPNAFFRDMS